MAFPVYQKHGLKISSEVDLESEITKDVNLRFPVIIEFSELSLMEETKLMHHLETHLEKLKINPKFPYPIYVITKVALEKPTSFTCLSSKKEIPRYFSQKDGRLNMKESHLLDKIRLLQQENSNSSSFENMQTLQKYAHNHRIIHKLDRERMAYQYLLKRLKKIEK